MTKINVSLTENDKRYLSLWPKPDSPWLRMSDIADRLGVTTITASAAISRLDKKLLVEKRGNRKIEGGAVEYLWLTTSLGDSVVENEHLAC